MIGNLFTTCLISKGKLATKLEGHSAAVRVELAVVNQLSPTHRHSTIKIAVHLGVVVLTFEAAHS